MPLLEVRSLELAFGGLAALKDVSFEAEEGTVTGLIGPNGAGKTTCFNVISGALAPDAGSVVFDGRELIGLATHRIARAGLARTFQLTRPFAELSVLDNIAVAALHHGRTLAVARRRAAELVEQLGLAQWSGQPAGTLSTAGRKRVELARALATEPRLLLLDEVLAGLVPAERAAVVEVLRGLAAEGMAMLLVEHVMPAVMALSDRIIVLDRGEVIAAGPPAEVTRSPAVIQAYLGDEDLTC